MGIGASLAHAMVGKAGALAGGAVAFMGAWILLKTQLDIIEGMTRAITDIHLDQQQTSASLARAVMSEWFTTACLRNGSVGSNRIAACCSRSSCCNWARTWPG